jgi:hypothetical protein
MGGTTDAACADSAGQPLYFQHKYHYLNTLQTGRHFIGFWLLTVADREPIIWLLGHAMLQSTIHCSGAMFLHTIGPECFA